MKRLFQILLAVALILALVVILFPMVSKKETLTYDEAAKQFAKGKFVTVDGKQVHYIEKGNGKPIILIHGYVYHSFGWKHNIEALGKQYKVYAIDLWGFGYSQRWNETDYSFALFGKQVAGFIDALNLKSAVLIGHSMGGGTAVYTAAHYPEKVESLILVAPSVLPHPRSAVTKVFELPFVGEFLGSLPGSILLKKIIKESCFYDSQKATNEYFEELFLPFKIQGTSAGALYMRRNIFKPPALRKEAELLARMNKPTVIVQGEADPLVPMENSRTLHDLWKGSKLVVFEKAKHNPHEEYPERFNKLVIDFISER